MLTTHHLEEAEALADRVAIMHEGRIAVAGTLAEIVGARPAGFTATVPTGVDRTGVRLADLRAAPASLADIYHAVRTEEGDAR